MSCGCADLALLNASPDSRHAAPPRSSLLEAPDAWIEHAYTRVNAVRAGDGDQPALVARAAAPSLARLRPTKEPQAQHIVQQGCGGKKARASQADSGRAELVVSMSQATTCRASQPSGDERMNHREVRAAVPLC